MLMGNARAKNIGMRRKAGVERRGRKWRRSRRTKTDIAKMERSANE